MWWKGAGFCRDGALGKTFQVGCVNAVPSVVWVKPVYPSQDGWIYLGMPKMCHPPSQLLWLEQERAVLSPTLKVRSVPWVSQGVPGCPRVMESHNPITFLHPCCREGIFWDDQQQSCFPWLM